ncbi:hypothetical protein RV10_GL000209 [Enterococcus pallens]|nr:hypothetical protein RV10_GL000209 [Enterococcus pallens]
MILLLLVISSCYSLVFFRNFETIYSTGDLSFHLSRIKGLSSIFSSPINYTTFNNSGYGVNFFYPYVTFFPAVIIFWITQNLILSYVLYVWLLNVVTIFVSFYYSKKILNKVNTAFLFSCIYTFSAYRTVDIYHRSAIAEAIAITAILPVLYYAYQIIFYKKNQQKELAISMSFLIYSHVLSTLICCSIIFVFIIIHIVIDQLSVNDLFNLVKRMIKSILITLVLTMYLWLPMIEQMVYQKINRPSETNLHTRSLSISDSFIGALNNDLTTYTIGFVGIIALVLPLTTLKYLNKKERIIYYSSILTWLITTSFFPWSLLQNTPINLIQFPWRLLVIQTIFGSLILAIVFAKKFNDKKNRASYFLGAIILLLILSIATKSNYSQKILSFPGHILVDEETIESYTTVGMDYFLYDYAPKDSLPLNEHISKHEVKIGETWEEGHYKAKSSSIIFDVFSNDNQKVTLPIYSYLGTEATVNGKLIDSSINANGLVTVPVVFGENRIVITTKNTLLSVIAAFFSISGYILVIIKYKNNRLRTDILYSGRK